MKYFLRHKETGEYLTVYGWSWAWMNKSCALKFPHRDFAPPRGMAAQCVKEWTQ